MSNIVDFTKYKEKQREEESEITIDMYTLDNTLFELFTNPDIIDGMEEGDEMQFDVSDEEFICLLQESQLANDNGIRKSSKYIKKFTCFVPPEKGPKKTK